MKKGGKQADIRKYFRGRSRSPSTSSSHSRSRPSTRADSRAESTSSRAQTPVLQDFEGMYLSSDSETELTKEQAISEPKPLPKKYRNNALSPNDIGLFRFLKGVAKNIRKFLTFF